MEEKSNEVTTRAQEICREIRRLTEELERQAQNEREILTRISQGNRLQLVITPVAAQDPNQRPPAGRRGTKIDAGIIDWISKLRRNW